LKAQQFTIARQNVIEKHVDLAGRELTPEQVEPSLRSLDKFEQSWQTFFKTNAGGRYAVAEQRYLTIRLFAENISEFLDNRIKEFFINEEIAIRNARQNPITYQNFQATKDLVRRIDDRLILGYTQVVTMDRIDPG
jgi:hypothetical protein